MTPEKSNALTIHDRHFGGVVTRRSASAWVPDLVAAGGPRATDAYIEFFTATIRNRNTRLAYARACYQFFHWCQENGLTLEAVKRLCEDFVRIVLVGLRQKYPDKLRLVEEFIVEIEGPPNNCDVTYGEDK